MHAERWKAGIGSNSEAKILSFLNNGDNLPLCNVPQNVFWKPVSWVCFSLSFPLLVESQLSSPHPLSTIVRLITKPFQPSKRTGGHWETERLAAWKMLPQEDHPIKGAWGAPTAPGLTAEERKTQGVTLPTLQGELVLTSSLPLFSLPDRALRHQEHGWHIVTAPKTFTDQPTSLYASCYLLNPPLSAWTPSAQTRRVQRTAGMKCALGPNSPSALWARPAPSYHPPSGA